MALSMTLGFRYCRERKNKPLSPAYSRNRCRIRSGARKGHIVETLIKLPDFDFPVPSIERSPETRDLAVARGESTAGPAIGTCDYASQRAGTDRSFATGADGRMKVPQRDAWRRKCHAIRLAGAAERLARAEGGGSSECTPCAF